MEQTVTVQVEMPADIYKRVCAYFGTAPVMRIELNKLIAAIAMTRDHGLAGWWREQAEKEIEQTVSKAQEYSGTSGGSDLEFLGRGVAQGMAWAVSRAEAMELGCWTYLMGKMGRVQAAIQDRRMPSEDTRFDMGIYLKMILRIREKGEWPGNG